MRTDTPSCVRLRDTLIWMLGIAATLLAFPFTAAAQTPLPPTTGIPSAVPMAPPSTGEVPRLRLPTDIPSTPLPAPATTTTPRVIGTLQSETPAPKATVPIQAQPGTGTGTAPTDPKPTTQPGLKGPLTNPLFSPTPPGLTTSPKITPATLEKLNKHIAKTIDPETTMDLVVGQTRVLVLKNTPFRMQIGDENIVAMSPSSPKELMLQGKAVGTTVLNIWFGDANDVAKQETLTYLIRVFPDPEAKERLEKAYKQLEDEINKHFKDCRIQLKLLGDKIVVSGRVRDYVQGGQILQIIRTNTGGGTGGGTGAGTGTGTAGSVTQTGGISDVSKVPLSQGGSGGDTTGATNAPNSENFLSLGGSNIINLLEVAGEQQVMLRVVVAEVSRAAARSVGLNFGIANSNGVIQFANLTGPVTGGSLGALGNIATTGGGGLAANLLMNSTSVPFALNALKTLSYSRSLAEPNLVTLNGRTANFQSGGQFPVPVIGGFGASFGGAGGLQGVQYVPYGVQLSFTPFITDRDRIRLQLSATVSARDLASGTGIGGGTVAGLTSRNVNTTVELRQGETIAVAGLIEANIGANSTRLPFLGDLPFLTNLTGMNTITAGEKELVIFLTPELTRPLEPGAKLPLPGCEILDPSDIEFYLIGRIEGRVKEFRSPIRTDFGRIRQYMRTESNHIAGPVGYAPVGANP